MPFLYSLDDDAGGAFAVDPNTGALTVKSVITAALGSTLTPVLRVKDLTYGTVTVQPLPIVVQGIYVPPVIPLTLGALSLSSAAATAGTPFSATISGQTQGSTIAAAASDGTSLTVSGSTVSGTFSTAGTVTASLTETLAGAIGSPKTTAIPVTVSAAPVNPALGTFDFSNASNSGLLAALGA